MREMGMILKWECYKRFQANRVIWAVLAAVFLLHLVLPVPEGWEGISGFSPLWTVTGNLILYPSIMIVILVYYQAAVYPTLSLIKDFRRPWKFLEATAERPFWQVYLIRLALNLSLAALALGYLALEADSLERFATENTGFLQYNMTLPETLGFLWTFCLAIPILASAAYLAASAWLSKKTWTTFGALGIFILLYFVYSALDAGIFFSWKAGWLLEGVYIAALFAVGVWLERVRLQKI